MHPENNSVSLRWCTCCKLMFSPEITSQRVCWDCRDNPPEHPLPEGDFPDEEEDK